MSVCCNPTHGLKSLALFVDALHVCLRLALGVLGRLGVVDRRPPLVNQACEAVKVDVCVTLRRLLADQVEGFRDKSEVEHDYRFGLDTKKAANPASSPLVYARGGIRTPTALRPLDP